MLNKKSIKVEISQHIKDLLFTHDRVILSGFGAFIAKYSPAKINEETKTISPPAKEILFDPKIIKDGGLLENQMAKRENISVEEAGKQIDEYVKTVISKLNAGKKVKFTDLGTFSKIKEGKIMFLYQPSGNLLLDSYGLPKISLPEKVLSTAKPETRMKTETPAGTKKPVNKRIFWIAIPVAIILILAGLYFIKPEIWNKGKNYVVALFDKKDKPENDKDTVIVENNNSNQNNIVENNTNNNNTNNDSQENQNVINPENTIIKPDNNNNVTNNVSEFLTAQVGKFYLIIGSLPTPELAKEELKRFEKIGIKADIVPSGTGRYRISIGEFNNSKDAAAYYENFHQKHKNINPWLWENK